VAISRLPHALGEEVAKRLAEKLDYGLFGIEIVDQIAREHGVQRELIAHLDEHVRSSVDRWVVDAFRARSFRESDYMRGVVRVVGTLAERGMAVIFGRGAPFILGPDRALRVLVVASDEARAQRLAHTQSISVKEAQARLRIDDAERLAFLRNFVADPDDARHFDLVVNTGSLGLDEGVRLIAAALPPVSAR
jgi:cytidylate kinase